MTDENQDTKVTRLFHAPRRNVLNESGQPIDNDKPIEQRITELFGEVDEELEPDSMAAAPEQVQLSVPIAAEWTKRGPPAGHHNAIECPQCYLPAWIASAECWNCGFEVLAWLAGIEAEQQAQLQTRQEEIERQERQEWQRVAAAIALVGIACFLFSVLASGPLRGALIVAGVTGLFLAWLISQWFG